ncbi:MAG: PAS domain S-box protein [Chloroflexi bacterium]|nr:PAS domain S-box protein [Chloroflexota bacterium]MDL1885193.1 PAS domain S-box protein [Anaerolineae bacterium CFX8]
MLMLPDYRVRQRDFLLEISRAMTAQLDLGEVLRLVLNASIVMLAGKMGIVALRDGNGLYRIRATIGIENERIPQLDHLLDEMVSLSDADADPEVLNTRLSKMAIALDRRLRQSLFLPLVIAGEPVGLLIVFRTYRMDATENDLQILQSFADQAAIAVHNAQLYARIDYERKRLAAILEYSADGVMILDAHLHIVGFNRALERMSGWLSQEALERDVDEVIVWKRVEKGDLRQALDEGWPFRTPATAPPEILYVEGDLLRRDGLTLSVGITYAPLLTTDGHLSNIIANVRDITNFRQAQEMQNVFISTISHELKTPVALIKGYAGTLNREDATWDPQVIREGLTVIEDEADRLTELIENLLATSKLKAERMRLDLSDVRLDQLAAQVVERFRTQTQQHELVLNFPPDFPIIQGDETRLRQVLDNLVSNAIKYSPNGGMIEIGGGVDDETVTVFVRDQGVGIPEREQERLFERFYRVDDTLSRRTKGTGLGLYLARTIIEAHGGRIRVKSKPGQGSTFYFTLPQR